MKVFLKADLRDIRRLMTDPAPVFKFNDGVQKSGEIMGAQNAFAEYRFHVLLAQVLTAAMKNGVGDTATAGTAAALMCIKEDEWIKSADELAVLFYGYSDMRVTSHKSSKLLAPNEIIVVFHGEVEYTDEAREADSKIFLASLRHQPGVTLDSPDYGVRSVRPIKRRLH